MKNILWLITGIVCAEIFLSTKAYACIDSDCRPCPIGFSITKKCCNDVNKNDCVFIGADIEDCGKGNWRQYPYSVPVKHSDFCCTDATENNCRSSGRYDRYCGEDDNKEFPYSPVKKCCKDASGNDCVIIRAKGYCGKYQFENYPVWDSDCCNSFFKKCTGHVNECAQSKFCG